MLQVLDTLTIFEAAGQSLGSSDEAFEWKLEKASTNTPFTVVARAQAIDPAVNITAHVQKVKAEVSRGLKALIEDKQAAPWMRPEVLKTMRGMLARNLNGIGQTDIDFEADAAAFVLDQKEAARGVSAVEAINVTEADDLPERESYGQIDGLLISAGRYQRKEAVSILTDLYGPVSCVLSPELVKRFGDAQVIGDVWRGKTIAVTGRLAYGKGGKLLKIDAQDIEYVDAARVDLRDVLDADFTSGLDPIHYLEQLHAGGFA